MQVNIFYIHYETWRVGRQKLWEQTVTIWMYNAHMKKIEFRCFFWRKTPYTYINYGVLHWFLTFLLNSVRALSLYLRMMQIKMQSCCDVAPILFSTTPNIL
jgi:hypothetical protein